MNKIVDFLKNIANGKFVSRKLLVFLLTMYVAPQLRKAGWPDELIQELFQFALGTVLSFAAVDGVKTGVEAIKNKN